MKVEKIEKHMSQNTVVVGENGVNTTIGVITQNDHTGVPACVSGISVGDDYAHSDYNWFTAKRVRKATDEEIARFFAWLREDGEDIANGFSRFGGRPPKGFEVAATTTEAAPEAGRVYGPGATQAEQSALVGKRVALVGEYEGAQGVVYRVDGSMIPYLVAMDEETGGYKNRWSKRVRLIEADAATTAPMPTEVRVYDRNAPEADIRALVGQMVEIVEAHPARHNGKIGRVLEASVDTLNIVRVEVEVESRGWWASKVRVVSAAPVAETKPALTQKVRYAVGDRVQLRAARPDEATIYPTKFAPGSIVTINRVAGDGDYSATGPVVHMGGAVHGQVGLAHADIAGLASESAPTVAPGKVYNADTPRTERDALVGKRVRYLDRDLNRGQAIGVCTKVDGSIYPYLVRFDDGGEAWSRSVELVEAAPATETKPVGKRLTVGDKAVAVYRSAPHMASIGTITRDDHDSLPYALDGKGLLYRNEHTFPLTVEGFRGAHAVQKAEGIVPENGDFVASIDNDGVADAGVLRNGYIVLTCSEADPEALDGAVKLVGLENWSDRMVVLCKAPKV